MDAEADCCVLCHRRLTPDIRTEEHVIPRALGNRSYVVKWTCSDCNHIMAHAFEEPVLRWGGFKGIYEAVLAPDAESWVEGRGFQVEGEEARAVKRRGELVLVGRPKRIEETDTIPIPLVDFEGNEHLFDLPLPEPFPKQVYGSIDEVKKHVERAEKKVQKFWQQLRDNPSLVPAFAAFLKEHDIDLDSQSRLEPPAFNFQFDDDSDEPNYVDLPPQERSIYFADVMRFFGKIAWFHTYQQLGAEAVNNPDAQAIANYLRFVEVRSKITDWIEKTDYEHQLLNEWIRTVEVNGRTIYLWKEWPERIQKKLRTCSLPANLVDEIRTSSMRRKQTRRAMTSLFIGDEEVAVKTRELTKNPDAARHRLRFRRLMREFEHGESSPCTCCQIQLFGGQIAVGVIVANYELDFDSGNEKVIELTG